MRKCVCLLILLPLWAQAEPLNEDKPFAEAHVLLQVSSADTARHSLVLDIANNLLVPAGFERNWEPCYPWTNLYIAHCIKHETPSAMYIAEVSCLRQCAMYKIGVQAQWIGKGINRGESSTLSGFNR